MNHRKYYRPDMILEGEHGEINMKAWHEAVAMYEDRAKTFDGDLSHWYLYGVFAALSKERTKHLEK